MVPSEPVWTVESLRSCTMYIKNQRCVAQTLQQLLRAQALLGTTLRRRTSCAKEKGSKRKSPKGDVKCALFAVPSLFVSSFLKPATANSATLHSRDPDPGPDTRSCLCRWFGGFLKSWTPIKTYHLTIQNSQRFTISKPSDWSILVLKIGTKSSKIIQNPGENEESLVDPCGFRLAIASATEIAPAAPAPSGDAAWTAPGYHLEPGPGEDNREENGAENRMNSTHLGVEIYL